MGDQKSSSPPSHPLYTELSGEESGEWDLRDSKSNTVVKIIPKQRFVPREIESKPIIIQDEMSSMSGFPPEIRSELREQAKFIMGATPAMLCERLDYFIDRLKQEQRRIAQALAQSRPVARAASA